MLFCINSIYGGLTAGVLAFLLWSLPGAIGMYGLSLCISRVGGTLPAPVYALLSGLNAATVGIIALAAVQLAQKAITDKLTLALVFLGGAAGMLYTALWYFPILMLAAGLITIIWDFRWLHQTVSLVKKTLKMSPELIDERVNTSRLPNARATNSSAIMSQEEDTEVVLQEPVHLRRARLDNENVILPTAEASHDVRNNNEPIQAAAASNLDLELCTWKAGICIICAFAISLMGILILRSLIKHPPLSISLFGNLYLAGTIIFGGGPVVIPLLREYIVAEGWVSARDFLLGLAIIQAFPGPNFNFAVYLGSLATANTSIPSVVGALIAFLGIFAPGIIIVFGFMGLWKVLRRQRWITSLLRGLNAAAVGLVYTAVYRLWQIGLVQAGYETGSPLGTDPWWVAITATSFVGGRWFGLPPPFAILLGGIMGLVWFGIAQA